MCTPLCKHFPACGGCTSQHLPYPLQLQQKEEEVHALFGPTRSSILPSPEIWHYRNKMEFSFSQNKAGDRFLGLILRKSRGKVFNLEECHISPLWFASHLASVRVWWKERGLPAFNFRSGEGLLRTVTFREGRRTGERMIMLTISADPRFAPKKEDLTAFVQAIGDPSISLFLRLQQCIKGEPTQFYEVHLGGPTHIREELTVLGKKLTFHISPTSFFQPNTLQAEQLYNAALGSVDLTPESVVFDLYCGTATLGMAAASRVKKVFAIEINPYAVFDARLNAEENGITNIEIVAGDVGKVLSSVTERPDVAILDPPRAGLGAQAIGEVLRLGARQILYISCNPKTQRADIEALTGYELEKVQPVDQFPHTPHIENIAVLRQISLVSPHSFRV